MEEIGKEESGGELAQNFKPREELWILVLALAGWLAVLGRNTTSLFFSLLTSGES